MPTGPQGPSVLKRVSNPPNPWVATEVEWDELPPPVASEVFEDSSRTILSKNSSPDVPFRWSVNPYRGCAHACSYCYARPGHEYLGWGAGTDFDRKLVVKPDAARLLRAAFDKRSWAGEMVVFSGVTDCYQPLEATWGLTRQCLEVCLDYRQPVGIITKSALIERDIDLLLELQREASLSVVISLPFLDDAAARAVEPGVPTPARRLKTLRRLVDAGLRVGVNVAPIIPGLNDEQIPGILEGAAEAGASFAGHILVRLPGPVAQVFEARLRERLPLRADRVLRQLESCRGGQISDARFGHRMSGQGPRWQAIEALYQATCHRLGLNRAIPPEPPSTFRRPHDREQLTLL